MLKYFKILGERCSGTNYLKELIKQNFLLEAPGYFGNKHFFGFNNYDEVVDELIVDNKIIKNAVVSDYFLFIAIIRCPFKWMNSFYRNPYYLPWVDEKTSKDEKIKAFLNQEWLSIKENKEIMEDRNYITGERYKNIFELRNLKTSSLSQRSVRKLVGI